MSGNRQRALGGRGQQLLDYLKQMKEENPSFFYSIQPNTGNILWADATSQMNYNYFGDTVIFDTSYRTNQYRVPFASFTGLNHHGQPVLFGCALLFDESGSSFNWLFQTWLHAMSGRHPTSLTTDPNQLIQAAVADILPAARHRFCKWAILRETHDKLSHIYQSHPSFEAEFQKCVNEADTIQEFESCWESLLQRYYLMDNEWIQSIYSARQQWIPIYLRDTFFGELSITDENEGTSTFFGGYVDAATTLQILVNQYEKAVATWHEKELGADYDTSNTDPILKTPSPMEKQAAGLYTRKIFMKFQEELVETLANPTTKIDDSGALATYRVAKFGEDNKACSVRFNAFEMKATCSCQMFEFSGIICRHILAVFRAKNLLTLPTLYVLKRWTRNAKSGGMLDEHASEAQSNSQESLTMRYNNLRQEAIKYVEEGAKSIHIYNVAMEALQKASVKVSAAKNQGSVTKQGSDLANAGPQEMHVFNESQVAPYQSVEKEKKILKLSTELDSTNQCCEVYRSNLLAILKDMEEQKLKLSVKVQNARLSLKE